MGAYVWKFALFAISQDYLLIQRLINHEHRHGNDRNTYHRFIRFMDELAARAKAARTVAICSRFQFRNRWIATRPTMIARFPRANVFLS